MGRRMWGDWKKHGLWNQNRIWIAALSPSGSLTAVRLHLSASVPSVTSGIMCTFRGGREEYRE